MDSKICPLSIASGKPEHCLENCKLLYDKDKCLLVQALFAKAAELKR